MRKINIPETVRTVALVLLLWALAYIAVLAQVPNTLSSSASPDSITLAKQAAGLIAAPNPTFATSKPVIDPADIAEMGFEQVYETVPTRYRMRDGKELFTYKFPSKNASTIILLHGILSSGYLMNKTSGLLQKATGAEVITLDLRGHGQSEGAPGDVQYIDQFADDIADVVAAVKKEKPNGRIILAGYSMGGGIALRYAMKNNAPAIDGYILLAPILGQNMPRQQSLNHSKQGINEEPLMKVHITRIIGLKMLNSVGEHRHDSLPVLFFNVPKEMIRQYSYRANESMSPEDYKAGLQAVKKPLLVLVGSNDKAFGSSQYEEAVKSNTNDGEVFIIEGATHYSVRHNAQSMRIIAEWTGKHNLVATAIKGK